MREILGVHVFQKTSEIDFEDDLAKIQYLSALSWKQFHGKIRLYTNEAWLDVMKRNGYDSVYDLIDTEELGTIPRKVNQTRFWAYGKLHVLAIIEEPCVIVDTDLWLRKPIELDDNMSYMGYHFENFNTQIDDSTYVDFENFVPSKYAGKWNRSLMATNSALLWLNNDELKQRWLSVVDEVVEQTSTMDIDDPKNVRLMVFIEQRLLPMIASEMNLRYGVFMPSIIYQSNEMLSSEMRWDPQPANWTEKQKEEYFSIRHIWGGKRFWKSEPSVRDAQMRVVNKNLDELETLIKNGKSYTEA
jgi:hypothetical protein